MSQVILFDLDGTLTESGEGIINCVQLALEKLGKKEEHPENLQCFIGPPLKEQFMKYAGLGEEEGEKAVVYYRERYTTTGIFENRLYPKIPELLELLKINNKILAVASSKPEVYVKQILEHFQIADYFTAIVGSELDGRRTEKAEVIEEALTAVHRRRTGQGSYGRRSESRCTGCHKLWSAMYRGCLRIRKPGRTGKAGAVYTQTVWKIWESLPVRTMKKPQKMLNLCGILFRTEKK